MEESMEFCSVALRECISLVANYQGKIASTIGKYAFDKTMDYRKHWNLLKDEVDFFRNAINNAEMLQQKIDSIQSGKFKLCSLKDLTKILRKSKVLLEFYDKESYIAMAKQMTNVSWFRTQIQYYLAYINNALSTFQIEFAIKQKELERISKFKTQQKREKAIEKLFLCGK